MKIATVNGERVVHTQMTLILERATGPLPTCPAAGAARPTIEADGSSSRHEQPLRILLIVECAGGGTGRHVLDLAQSLIARGCDVHMLYSTGRIDSLFQQRLARIQNLNHTIVSMRTGPHPSDFSAVRAIRRYLRENGPF